VSYAKLADAFRKAGDKTNYNVKFATDTKSTAIAVYNEPFQYVTCVTSFDTLARKIHDDVALSRMNTFVSQRPLRPSAIHDPRQPARHSEPGVPRAPRELLISHSGGRSGTLI
jgi:hypothetical protein